MHKSPCSSECAPNKKNTMCVLIYIFFCLAAEPMDSVCDGAVSREPSKACQAEIKCVLSADSPKKEADNPAVTEPQKEVVDAAPASLESSRKDAESVPDERTKAKVPKPGKT